MRLAVLAIGAAVLLAGCVEGPFGGAHRDAAAGILPAEARAKADAVAAAWKEDAVLVTLKGDAHGAQEPGLFTFGNPGTAVFLDGRAGGWQFSYAVPGTVALMLATVDADGGVDTRQLDLSSFTPDTAGYEEYFEMTPIDPAWLDMATLVSVVRENATTAPLAEGEVESVTYTLRPDVRASYAWTVEVLRDDAVASFAVDPETWTFLSGEVEYRSGASASLAKDDDAGKPPSGLSVRTAYGTRADGEPISALRFDLAYSKASRAFDIHELWIEVDTGRGVREHRLGGARAFEPIGLEGEVEPGARFGVAIPLDEEDRLGTRTPVKVAFHTPKGAALRYEGTTPITFGRMTAVPLE